jgi:hypothetical protein
MQEQLPRVVVPYVVSRILPIIARASRELE